MIPSPEEFEIIDAHTHPFLDYENGAIGSFGSPLDMKEFDSEMKKVGIDRYAGSPLTRHAVTDFSEIVRLNEDVLRIRDAYPDYIPGMMVHGSFPEESCGLLEKMYRSEGIRYIGEMVPYMMGTGEYNSPGMIAILKEAGKRGMTVNFHDGTRESVIPVLENCPGLNVILAHPGEPGNAKWRFDFLAEYDNLYMDTSGYGIFRWNMLRYGIDKAGVKKFVFGSDMPTCSPGMYLYGVLCENLTKEELRLVLAENLKRILGIS